MSTNKGAKSPSTRRYTEEQKAQAVRLVQQLTGELGTADGVVLGLSCHCRPLARRAAQETP